eukprot:Em0020g924a
MWDLGTGFTDVGPGDWSYGCGTWGLELRMWDLGTGVTDVGPGDWSYGCQHSIVVRGHRSAQHCGTGSQVSTALCPANSPVIYGMDSSVLSDKNSFLSYLARIHCSLHTLQCTHPMIKGTGS